MGLTWACGGGRRRRGAGEGRRLRRRQITALALGELAAEHPAHRGQQPEEDPSAAHTIEVAAEAGHIPLPPERVEKRASSTHQTPPSTQKFEETVRPQRALETLNSAPCAATPRGRWRRSRRPAAHPPRVHCPNLLHPSCIQIGTDGSGLPTH
ncbi:hypothetical protein MTP99_019435 [Tenebrio molitor]|jgi:hypothetical protein|nr:hypothetical protein MTP99_019435 [Tenebrio molitor]